MKLKGLLFVYCNVRYVLRLAHRERPVAAVMYAFREMFNLFCSLLAAKIVGWPYSNLGAGSKILGTKAIAVSGYASIKRNAWIEAVYSYFDQSFTPSIKIGQNFFASDRLHISCINRIEIGDDCLFGSGIYISDHNHGSYKGTEQSSPLEPPIRRKLVSYGPVIIGRNVWLGDNVVIVGAVTIGNGAVIGANCVVTQDVPEHVMVAGSPMRCIKKFNEANGRWEKIER